MTSACVNLSKLQDILNTVSYQEQAIAYSLDHDNTTMQFSVGDTSGSFRVFSAQLGFDQAHVTSGQLAVTVATASIDLTNPLLEEMLRGESWFYSSTHPLAAFSTSTLDIEDTHQLTAHGQLTLKSISQPLSMRVFFPDGIPDLHNPPVQFPFTANGSFSRAGFAMTGLTEFAPDQVELVVSGVFVRGVAQIDSTPHIAEQ